MHESHLTPYVGSDLQGFNGASTKPWGYVELIVTFRRGVTARAIKTQFLVVDYPSLYKCIFERPALVELIAVSSIVHLKMKYYIAEGLVATLHGDIQVARRCFEAPTKGMSSINVQP